MRQARGEAAESNAERTKPRGSRESQPQHPKGPTAHNVPHREQPNCSCAGTYVVMFARTRKGARDSSAISVDGDNILERSLAAPARRWGERPRLRPSPHAGERCPAPHRG